MNYKELWEGLKELDGHRKLKSFTDYPEKEYKTIKECMESIERLEKLNRLKAIVKHHKEWRGDCG